MKTKTLFIFSFFLGSLLWVACGGESASTAKESQLTGDIKIDGSSTVYPITEAIAEEFRSEESKVRVTIGVSGTGGGFKKFCRGETVISNASRPIKQKEITQCGETNISYHESIVAYDGMAVLINPDNDWVKQFTVSELKKIWEPAAQGTIMRWNQIRPEWPNEEIHLFGPGVASGTFDYFTEVICGESGASRGDYTASEDDNVLVQGIATDRYSLGFFGLAYYQENKDKLKLVAVDNGNGAILPSMETVKNGTYAPLSRPLYVYTNSEAIKQPHVVAFMKYYLETASEVAGSVGYIPLPDEEYINQQKLFENFTRTN